MSSEISEKKLLANKMNAKKSTGPKTANGKNRASMNSLKHGLNARKFMLKDENIEEFEEYYNKYKGSDLVTFAVGPHSLYTCSQDYLKKCEKESMFDYENSI
jgi:cytosine/adenosine deaminase-related metal-dependent hydrolase